MKEVVITSKNKNYYTTPKGYMSLADEIISEGELKANYNITNCRELLISRLLSSMAEHLGKRSWCNKHLSKLRIVFYNTDLSEDKIEKVVAFINNIEDTYNILRTEVSRALSYKYKMPQTRREKPVVVGTVPNTYLFEANEIWMRSSVMVSLYVLLLRFYIMNYNTLSGRNITDIDGVLKFVENYKGSSFIRDGEFVNCTVKYWDMVLTNRDILFPPAEHLLDYYDHRKIFSLKSTFKISGWSELVYCFGISMLVNSSVIGSARHFNAYKTFHELLNQGVMNVEKY